MKSKPSGIAALILAEKPGRKEKEAYKFDEEDGDEASVSEESEMPDIALEDASDTLIKAIHARDCAMVADALKMVFEILDSSPHEEGEHV